MSLSPASNVVDPKVAASESGSIHEKIELRPLVPADLEWVIPQQERAFGPGRFTRAAFIVRETGATDYEVSFAAQIEGKPIGSVIMTPISVGGATGCLLGPLTVDVEAQNLGAGRKMVAKAVDAALAKAEYEFVILVGDRAYYEALGFAPSALGAIKFPAPVDPERILVNSAQEGLALKLKGPIVSV